MLYLWNSKLLKAYRDGDIIVMAESVEEARNKARKFFNVAYPAAPVGQDIEKWEQDYYDEFKRLFEEDIAVEPAKVETGVIFIQGSE